MDRKGYLPHKVIKGFVFWLLLTCIIVATVTGILYSWEIIDTKIANNCLWTVFILSLGSVSFLFINCLFGDFGSISLGKTESPPNIDEAFAERLRKSKVENASGFRSISAE